MQSPRNAEKNRDRTPSDSGSLPERCRIHGQLAAQRQAIEADGINLQRVVVLDVREVSLERLIADLLRPNGLDFVRSGQQITVMPAQK